MNVVSNPKQYGYIVYVAISEMLSFPPCRYEARAASGEVLEQYFRSEH